MAGRKDRKRRETKWERNKKKSAGLAIDFSISSSSSSRTDRWVHFQQNAGLRLFVHTCAQTLVCAQSTIGLFVQLWTEHLRLV